MEKAYFNRLNVMKRFCVCEAVLLFCIAGFVTEMVFLCIDKRWLWCIVTLLLLVFAIIGLVLYNKHMRRVAVPAPYVLKLSVPMGKESVFDKLQAQTYLQNSKRYSENEVIFFFQKHLHIRVLAVYLPNFSKSEFDRSKKRLNAKINKEFSVKQEVSRLEAVKSLRLNLIVTDISNSELQTYLSRNAADTMRRVEGVLNIAIDLSRGELFIPVMFGDCVYSDIRKYERCIKEICRLTNQPYKHNR